MIVHLSDETRDLVKSAVSAVENIHVGLSEMARAIGEAGDGVSDGLTAIAEAITTASERDTVITESVHETITVSTDGD